MDFSKICEQIDEVNPHVPSIPYWCIYDDENSEMYEIYDDYGCEDVVKKVKDRIKEILDMTEEEFVETFHGSKIELCYDSAIADGFEHICDIRKPIGYDDDDDSDDE